MTATACCRNLERRSSLYILNRIGILKARRGAVIDGEHGKATIRETLAEASVDDAVFQGWGVELQRRIKSTAGDEYYSDTVRLCGIVDINQECEARIHAVDDVLLDADLRGCLRGQKTFLSEQTSRGELAGL